MNKMADKRQFIMKGMTFACMASLCIYAIGAEEPFNYFPTDYGVISGLSEEEASLISFNEDGYMIFDENIDMSGRSVYFNDLITLGKSQRKYIYEGVYEAMVGEDLIIMYSHTKYGHVGITVFPDILTSLSPDEDVHIYTSLRAGPLKRATNIAHETGHAYIYEMGGDPLHQYKSVNDASENAIVLAETNINLDKHLRRLERSASLNFILRLLKSR